MVDAVIGYDELVRSVPIWLIATNTALVAEMPQVIHDAIDELMTIVDHDLFEAPVELDPIGPPASSPDPDTDYSLVDATNDELQIMELRTIQLRHRTNQEWVSLQKREYTYLSSLYSRNRSARPRFYANYGGTLKYKVFPYPDQEYEVRVLANVRPPYLTTGDDTNLLTTQFPTAVKNMVLRHASIFMKNQVDAKMYLQLASDAIPVANTQMARRRRDEAAQRPQETTNAVGR